MMTFRLAHKLRVLLCVILSLEGCATKTASLDFSGF